MEPTTGQLAQHLRALTDARLLDPLEVLLESADEVAGVRRQIADRTGTWARDILDGDRATAMRTVSRLIAALYPGDGPFDPPARWWATPLGQAVVRRLGHPGAAVVSYPVAGAMLGVTRQFVHNLVTRGKLERHPGGGVTVDSVRARLAAHPTTAPDATPGAAPPTAAHDGHDAGGRA
ncbi:MAG TPA: hypothetical protein VK891_14680 [Euzebyales bacterium]|nr:hypothetical protein [Euzebyales bacterium]